MSVILFYTARLTINLRSRGGAVQLINDLVNDYERGRVTRRELIQTLALLAAAGASASAAPLKSGSINHVSVLVSDMARSIDFYNRVFGLSVQNEDKANKIARLGSGGKVLVSLRVEPPPGLVDHFAIGVDGFNREAVTKELQTMGLMPRENLEFGFHVKDPDGAHVQITGI
jgi:catechol 2,3-dioxygenase-like lactoylglutathione lyase family enzyme